MPISIVLSAMTGVLLGYLAWRGTGSFSRGFSVGCASLLAVVLVPAIIGANFTTETSMSPEVMYDAGPAIVVGNLIAWLAIAFLFLRRA